MSPTGAAVEYSRDAFGRIDTVRDPLAGVTRISWTPEGKRRERVGPDGAMERWYWDAEGNLLEYTDSAGKTTKSEYSHFDLLVSRSSLTGGSLRFEYDTELRLTAVTNAQSLTWKYVYDAVGHLVQEEDFNTRSVSYFHDEVGRLIRQVNGAEETTEYLRDINGNIVEKRVGDTATIFRYDNAGLLKEAISSDVHLALAHDEYGRVTQETINGWTSTFSYDLAGRRTTRVTPSGARSNWGYDVDGLPQELVASDHALRFAHDAAGREKEIRLDDVLAVRQAWDVMHRLSAQTIVPTEGAEHSNSATVNIERRYIHGPAGLIESIDSRDGRKRYELDAAGRATAVRAESWTESYA